MVRQLNGNEFVGVDEEDGKPKLPPVGLELDHIDKIQKELLNYCHLMKPTYFPIVEPTTYKGKHILIIWAPGGQNRPYQCLKTVTGKYKDYEYYVRHFSNTIAAKDHEKVELYNLAGNIPFDDRMHFNAEVGDLKLTLIKEYLRDVRSDLYSRASDIPMPKNIGILMFNDSPQHFIPMSQIELVHFKGSTEDNVFSEKIFVGPIHEQIPEVLKYIKNSLIETKVILIITS